MGLLFKKCPRGRVVPLKKASGLNADILTRLRAFLDAEEPKAVKWLVSFWNNQSAAVTYKELREAVLAGDISVGQLEKWQRDYARLVNTKLAPQWYRAMAAAATDHVALYPDILFEPMIAAAQDYIQSRGADLITALASEQRNAIRNMIAQATHYEAITADSLSRIIRPVIGLTAPQAQANMRYWARVWQSSVESGLSSKAAEKRANDLAATYAARQHRYRAQMIARTELASAYNRGAYGATKDAQEQGYLGDCKKVWLTADDERVCKECGALDGESVNMDALFSSGDFLPPAHPSCRCAVAYEEVAKPMMLNRPPAAPPAESRRIPAGEHSSAYEYDAPAARIAKTFLQVLRGEEP